MINALDIVNKATELGFYKYRIIPVDLYFWVKNRLKWEMQPVGDFSVGALSIGKYFAMGDNARAMIALGGTADYNIKCKQGSLIEANDLQVTVVNRLEVKT